MSNLYLALLMGFAGYKIFDQFLWKAEACGIVGYLGKEPRAGEVIS